MKLLGRHLAFAGVAAILACGGTPERVVSPRPKEEVPLAFVREQADGARTNPRGVTFRIELRAGSRYHLGQRIPVTLAFSSSVPKTYRLDGGLYDRSGRLDLDTYRLWPDGAVKDPLKDYFEFAGGMGGLRVMPILDEKPHEMTFDLNEWARFDQPGHYQLFVRSNRLSFDDGGAARERAATSNAVNLEIAAPDAAWEEETRRSAVQAFDTAKDDEARRAAARILRFLGTPAACEDMARRIRGGSSEFDLEMGLVGARSRDAAIAAMEAQLAEPDFPVTRYFLDTLALLRAKKDRRPDPQLVRRRSVEGALAVRIAKVLGAKGSAARAATLRTLLEVAWSAPAGPAPAWLLEIAPQIAWALQALPPDEARELLDQRWRRFGGPALLPTLRAIDGDAATWPELRRAALARIATLDPDGFRARVLEIIRDGAPSLGLRGFEVLGSLRAGTLPELDGALASRIEACAPPARSDSCTYADFLLTTRLAARYASAAIEARIKAACPATERFAEDTGAALLAYFLRVDPAYGKALATEAFQRAKKKLGPYSLRILDQASELAMTPELEGVLLDALREPSSELAAEAAETLGKRGSSAAERPLWDRLEAWHAAWEGREAELRYRVSEENKHVDDIHLETALVTALAEGAGWLADGSKLERLARLAVSANERQRVSSSLADWKAARIAMSFVRGDSGDLVMGRIAQYSVSSIDAALAKLGEFPAGTTFSWSGDADSDFETLRRFAEAHAMTLAR